MTCTCCKVGGSGGTTSGYGGLTLENVTSQEDETASRALARMDKKFWAAVEGEGTFVANDSYPTQTMWLYSPVWDFDLPDLQKVLLSFDIVTRPLPANTRLDLEYRMDEADDWTSRRDAHEVDDTVKTRFTISHVDETQSSPRSNGGVGLTSLDGLDTPRVLSVTRAGLRPGLRGLLRHDRSCSTMTPRPSGCGPSSSRAGRRPAAVGRTRRRRTSSPSRTTTPRRCSADLDSTRW